MGSRVRSSAKVAPGLRGHLAKDGATLSGARRGPYRPAWIRRDLAFAAPVDLSPAGTLDVPVLPVPEPEADEDGPAIDLRSLFLAFLFLAALVAVSAIRI